MKGYLCCYDYGMGGTWVYLTANSPDAITDRYPWLRVVEVRPNWMTEELEQKIRSHDLERSQWKEFFKECEMQFKLHGKPG